jgi:SagB-type dehydrogenase family enzyme
VSVEISFRSVVYGADRVDLADPAENYHEASKLSPALAALQTAGISRLSLSPALQAATSRPVRRNPQLHAVELPRPAHPDASLWATVDRRRSARGFDGSDLRLRTLATLLDTGYGVRGQQRSVPSGGALYPLELYVASCRVDGLAPGVFHFDPERRVLETLRVADIADELDGASALPGVVADAAAVVFVTAVFWRTRFKYGLRGYRFALLEAGHAMQNVLLAATALSTPALPLGGFYDGRVEDVLGVDGVDEAVLYGVVLGGDRA